MAQIPTDWDEIPDSDFTLIPVGTYTAIIRKSDIEEKGGKDCIAIEMEIDSGDCEGRLLWDRLFLTEKALWKLKNLAGSTGVEGDGFEFPHEELVNKTVSVVVSHREYEGKTYNQVDHYRTATIVDEFTKIENAGFDDNIPVPTEDDLPDDW